MACRVMTNGDLEGQMFLFHPHTNIILILRTTKYHNVDIGKYEKSFRNIPNSLRCGMVTSFEHINEDVRFISFPRAGRVWLKTMEIPNWYARI